MSIPGSPTFRPQRFSRSRRVAPPRTSWACFIPLPRAGFTFQGFSPLPSCRCSSQRHPLLMLAVRAYHRASSMTPACTTSPPGGSSRQRSVATASLFRPGDARSPLRVSPLRDFLRAPWLRLRGSSAHDLPRRASSDSTSWPSAYRSAPDPRALSPEHASRSSFLDCLGGHRSDRFQRDPIRLSSDPVGPPSWFVDIAALVPRCSWPQHCEVQGPDSPPDVDAPDMSCGHPADRL